MTDDRRVNSIGIAPITGDAMSPATRKPGTSDQQPLDVPEQHDRAHPAAQSIQALTDFGLLLSVEEAARLLGIGRTLMFELIGSGAVTSVRIGRLRRVPVNALDRYVRSLEESAQPRNGSPGM
jgi:excisionase family DNA binding protein